MKNKIFINMRILEHSKISKICASINYHTNEYATSILFVYKYDLLFIT